MGQRVLLTTDVVGGVWDFSVALAHQLLGRGHGQVSLLALGEPSPAQINQAQQAGMRLIVEPLKLEWMQGADADVLRTREVVARLVRELRPDVVHANQFAPACAAVDVPVVLTLHSDVLSWHRWTLGVTETPTAWQAYERLVREALDRAERVVAVSGFLAAEVQKAYDYQRLIDVIHNGWAEERQSFEPGERSSVTLIAGRIWDGAKNVSLAARAAQSWNCGRVFLAGQQTNPDSGQRVEIPMPLESLGFLSRAELGAALRSALIYLSPARYDPFGLLPLQAALNGCALLLSDIPSYRELWDGAAQFFRSDDIADLRRHWARLLDRPDLARDLASRAQRRARERYTAARMGDAYANLYASLSGLRSRVAV